jgi:topoisomerase-4 subunit A
MAEETLDLFADGKVETMTEKPQGMHDRARNEPPEVPPTVTVSSPGGEETHNLAEYTHQIYMRYARSVLEDRAIPSVADGQKPVQRRILYAMHRLGLTAGAKPVKSARVVGDVIGKYHPHGDSASYEAMVRMAQDFALRYPLVDGQGNFGSRDGDSPAAMRYTETRLTKFAELLLSEVDAGTVEFVPNYDGADTEPALLPARVPMLLLNGASGIAVGMATECPPHNLREVAAAAVAILRHDATLPPFGVEQLMQHIPGPDFPGGGQLVSGRDEICATYETGRGSVRLRARWEIEKQARGQWRMVIHELPYGVSAKKILEELGELTDPKVRAGKKDLTPEQKSLKAVFLDAIETMRDESGKDAAVRIVLEPRSSRMDQEQFIALLLANTSLESTVPLNLVSLGLDGRPTQKSLVQMLTEWVSFRVATVYRRSETRLAKVNERIHILEGRMIAFLNIDEVIRVIRESDDPKADLMARWPLSEIQAEDILEIRLRQLARMEGIKIEKELGELKREAKGLRHILGDGDALRALVAEEIEADAAKYGDGRRTLIEAVGKVSLDKTATIPDEPCTVILSRNGWIRQRAGHDVDMAVLSFKDGDGLLAIEKTRTVHPVVVVDSSGRAYSLSLPDIPGGRSDGVPLASLMDMPPRTKAAVMCAASPETRYLFSTSAGYGFIATLKDLVSRQRAGKAFMTVGEGDVLLPPAVVGQGSLIVALGSSGRLLAFPISEMKELSGGKGVIILGLNDDEMLIATAVLPEMASLRIGGAGRGGKSSERILDWETLQQYVLHRARKGIVPPVKFKPERIEAVS